MLFGKKPQAEPVPVAALKDFVNAAFDAKLASFSRNAEDARRRILQSEDAFIAACERFRELDAEPDFEGMVPVNVTYIKSRKTAYADALGQHVLASRRDHTRHTRYHSYSEALAQADEAIASINSTNSIFRQVFLAYAAHLGELKKTFADMERGSKRLASELKNVSEDADAYTETTIKIDAVIGLISELEALDVLEGELSGAAPDGTAGMQSKTHEMLESKRAELAEAESRAVAEASALKNMMMPIGRIARKYDHGSTHKRLLSDMVTRPETELATDRDYEEFVERLRDLLKSIGNGSIDVSSDADAVGNINGLMAKDIRASVRAYRSAASDRAELEKQVAALSAEVGRVEKAKLSEEKRAAQLRELGDRKLGIRAKISEHASAVEGLVLNHYRRRIRVVV